MTSLLHAAQPLHPSDRSAFLETVAASLRDQPIIGDGLIGRTLREIQAEFLLGRRPVVEPPSGKPGKYAKDWARRPSKRRRRTG
jgi:hypothetical protein